MNRIATDNVKTEELVVSPSSSESSESSSESTESSDSQTKETASLVFPSGHAAIHSPPSITVAHKVQTSAILVCLASQSEGALSSVQILVDASAVNPSAHSPHTPAVIPVEQSAHAAGVPVTV